MNPAIGLKWSAAFFAVFWTAGMLLWTGVFEFVNITITTIGGAIAGYFWYRAMHWVMIRRERPIR